MAKPAAAQPSDLDQRLAKAGLTRGAPVLLRIFKEESELELWMQTGGVYKLFATYPICRWKGVLGPKLFEGDKQSPEGFYSFGQESLIWQGHYFRAFNVNFPNVLDRSLGRTGSGILIHGACSSIGCFAMTDSTIDEIFDLIVAGFANGQARVQVHQFPFKMTADNLNKQAGSPWIGFWRDLKPASDLFVATRLPPRIGVCDGRYVVRPGVLADGSGDHLADWCSSPIAVADPGRLAQLMAERRAAAAPPPENATEKPPSERVKLYAQLVAQGQMPKPRPLPDKPSSYGPSPNIGNSGAGALPAVLVALPDAERAALLGVRIPGQPGIAAPSAGVGAGRNVSPVSANSCNPALPACRHFMASNAGVPPAARKTRTTVVKR